MTMVQTRLQGKDVKLNKPYNLDSYNKFNSEEQWIRISEGCVNNCPFCYEPTELKLFSIPEIVRNKVKIMDMNLLCKPEALAIIRELGQKRINGKVVYYELICGIDYRFLTQEIADALKANRFTRIRIAWDWHLENQVHIKDALRKLERAGYEKRELMVFMICNWRITYAENMRKLDLCKYWGVKVCDCYFDGQTMPNVVPIFWKHEEIKAFRRMVRKHNQIVNFMVDPEMVNEAKKPCL